MGIYNGAKLIAGWEIKHKPFYEFLRSNKFVGCGEHDVYEGKDWKAIEVWEQPEVVCCNCFEQMETLPLPVGFTLDYCYPSFDCKPCYRHYFLTLANLGDDKHDITAMALTLQNADWSVAQKLAIELGVEKDEPPKIFAQGNVT